MKLEHDLLERVLDLTVDITARCFETADWERAERWADMTWAVSQRLDHEPPVKS